MKFAAAIAAVLALSGSVNAFGPLCGAKPSTRVLPEPTTMPNDFQVAFIGDAGSGNEQGEVLSLIKKWGAKVVIHSGDFEYDNDPALFESNINAVLGPDFPYFASIGNHDNLRWSGHEERLVARLQRFGGDKNCTGDYGVNMVCNWNGLYFVLSGVGTRGSDHADFIDEVFTGYPAVWKFVSWHKNQRKMQIGGKLDETGWAVYDTSRKHGAIIATGHEHSYCRSHLLSNFEDQVIASTNKTLNLQVGETFAFVSGLGGKDIRDWNENLRTNPWWAAVGASDNGIGDGALLCTFNIGGNLRKAHCFFEDTTGKIWDDFDIYSNLPETKEELTAALANFDKTEPACRSKWIEVAVKRGNADVREDLATGHTTCGESVINFDSKSITVMKFENVPVKKGARIQHAYLQVYGATTDKELPQFLISGSTDKSPLHCGKSAAPSFASRKTTKASVEWSEEDEEWETENVWVSPDLKDIVTELINDPAWEEGNPISINMLGQGRQSFYSFDFGPCFAPTLAIELEPEC